MQIAASKRGGEGLYSSPYFTLQGTEAAPLVLFVGTSALRKATSLPTSGHNNDARIGYVEA
jgi:hypothetical protein